MGLLDLFSGGGNSDAGGLYGDSLTPDQQKALAYRGLLGFLGGMQKSGALDYTVPFISGKVPGGFAAGLAGGMAGAGAAQDAAAETAMKAQLLGLQGKQLGFTIDTQKDLGKSLDALNQYISGGGGAAPAAAPAAATAPAADTAGDTVVPPAGMRAPTMAGTNLGVGGATSGGASGYPFPTLPATAQFPNLPPNSTNGVMSGPGWPEGSGPKPVQASYDPTRQPLGRVPGLLAQAAGNAPAAPTGGLLAQVAQGQPPTASPMSAPGGAPLATGYDPKLAALLAGIGAKASIAKLGDVVKPYETYLYNQPGYKGAVRGAEAEAENASKYRYAGPIKEAETNALNRSDLIYKPQIAGLTKAAELPHTIDRVRPGDIQTRGGVPQFATPQLTETTDPATGRLMRSYMTPPLPTMPNAPGRASSLGPQPGATPMPGAAAGGGASPPPEIAKLGPGEVTEREHIGKTLGEEYGNAVKGYDAAQKAMPALDTMKTALANFRTGRFAGDRLMLGQAWQDFKGSMGISPDSDLSKWISSGEVITKEGTRLGFELARTLGSREAQNIVQQAIATNPGIGTSPQGNEKLIDLIQQGLNRDVDRRAFYDQWIRPDGGGHGSLAGAATSFDKSKPANYYVSQVLPLHIKTPGELKSLAPGTQYFRGTDERNVYRVE